MTRLQAIRLGSELPEFGEVDHSSSEVYAAYCRQPVSVALAESRQVTEALVDELSACSDEDLTDPSRHAWLRGRMLWLQVVVRGFWHPMGHVGDYFSSHSQPARAVALHSHALATARYLGAPDPVLGMASYSLACAQSLAGLLEEAATSLIGAVGFNPDVAVNARRDPDLEGLRVSGLLGDLLAD